MAEVHDGLLKLSLELTNTTPVKNASEVNRKDAMLQAFVSAHVLLGVTGGGLFLCWKRQTNSAELLRNA